MSVSTLKDIAFYNIVEHLWYNSKLRNLALSRAYNNRSYGSDGNKSNKIESKIEELTKSLCNQIAALSNVPKIIKAYIATALSNIIDEINYFIDVAIENMLAVSKVKIKILVKRIKLTPKGFVDKKKCLLSTIGDSQFGIYFKKDILLKNGIFKEELLKITDTIINNNSRKLMKQKDVDALDKHPSLLEYFEKLGDYDEDTPSHYYGLNVMEILIYETSWGLLPYYYNTIDPSERDVELRVAADFVFDHMLILSPEPLMFLYENMREDKWNKYVVTHFEKIVAGFLDCWRNLHLIIRWFHIAVKDADKARFLRAFRNIIGHLKYATHEKFIICEVIKNIWMNTSKILTNDNEVMDIVLKSLITQDAKEFNLLEFILRTYDTEKQKCVLIKTLFCTLTESKANSLDDMTQIITNLGFDKEQLKENLTCDVVKEMLINEYSIANKKAAEFDKILDFFDNKKEPSFKDIILMDVEYIAKLLDKHWLEKNLKEFILWLNHNSNEKYAKFILNLKSNGIIEKVYEKVIMDIGHFDHIKDVDIESRFSIIRAMMNGHIVVADEGLDNLKISKSEKNAIKKAVLIKAEVQKHILICYFRCESMYDITKEWNLFYDDIESGKKFFTEMFLTEEGKEAILDLVLYCRKMHKVYRYEEQIKYYSKLRKNFLDIYDLKSVVDQVLREHGHPNAEGDAILFEGREPKTDEETFIGKTIVDFKYRTLRAVLNSPTPSIRYNKKTVGFFGDLSIKLARRVGLNIPEVK